MATAAAPSPETDEDRARYAEELVSEFLLFRGFTSTLRSLDLDLSSDHAHAFRVDRVLDLVFSVYIPHFEFDKLQSLISFLKKTFFTPNEARYASSLAKFETSIKRYYIVYAIQKGRIDRVLDFFQRHGAALLQSGEDWNAWFALPYLKGPQSDPQFQVYFSKEWMETLVVSFGNFLNEVLSGIRIPALMKVTSELLTGRVLKSKFEELSNDHEHLKAELEIKNREIYELRRLLSVCFQKVGSKQDNESTLNNLADELAKVSGVQKTIDLGLKHLSGSFQDSALLESKSPDTGNFETNFLPSYSTASDDHLTGAEAGLLEDDFPQVSFESQETFSGHTSPITRCRFSSGGGNIASASSDGTVRVWNSDSGSSTSKNATIYCGADVLSLEWDYKSDRLLLIGTAEHSIKAWNVDAKRVVCDLVTDSTYPRILDLRCSPVEPLFVSAAASIGYGGESLEAKGFASLTLWNMKTWKPLSVLPLGEDPPAITSICFNHNGKMLAAGATDGMIHLFDPYARLPITGWPAHDSSVSCVRFGPDQASIFSLGSDGKILEWSLHNQGQVLQEYNVARFCEVSEPNVPRHEMAIDAQGKMMLLTSNTSIAPVYHLQKKQYKRHTLQHNAAITSVDWHPSQNKFLTGSADHSVRITSLRSSVFL